MTRMEHGDTPMIAEGETGRPGLCERDLTMLAFEKQWWKYSGRKEQAISELFGLSPTRYYQLLNRLIDSPAALRAEPMLIKRLRRVRGGKARTRQLGQWGLGSLTETDAENVRY